MDKNEPPPRAIKIQGQANLKIDFDIDVGLLMTSIPSRDAVDEEQIVWDWEQQFSQLTAEFLSRIENIMFFDRLEPHIDPMLD